LIRKKETKEREDRGAFHRKGGSHTPLSNVTEAQGGDKEKRLFFYPEKKGGRLWCVEGHAPGRRRAFPSGGKVPPSVGEKTKEEHSSGKEKGITLTDIMQPGQYKSAVEKKAFPEQHAKRGEENKGSCAKEELLFEKRMVIRRVPWS